MSRPFLIWLFLSSTLFSSGQNADSVCLPKIKGLEGRVKGLNKPHSDTSRLYLCHRKRGDTSELPLFIVNHFKTNHFNEFIFNSSTFKSIDVLKREKAVKKYGEQAKYGALIIKISDSVSLIPLNNLLDQFNIKLQDRSLPICINEDFIWKPENIKADLAGVKSIEIKQGTYWFYTAPVATPQKFINITTK